MNLKKRSMLITASAIVLTTAAIGAYKAFGSSGQGRQPPTLAQLQKWQFSLPQMTTNLQGSSIIQITFTLQAPNATVFAELQQSSAQIQDAAVGVLHRLTGSEVMRPDGRQAIKRLLAKRVDSLLRSGRITTVYIDSMIVQ